MSENFRDVSLVQPVARVIFALGNTVIVTAGSYFGIHWIFGIG